jgi:anti-sigma regulatory factor (Ser/Thr protein kinase)
MVTEPFFAAEFPSEFETMSQVLGDALHELVARGFIDSEEEVRARLCLEEAMVNAIQHGNQGQESRKVRIELVDEGLRCLIRVYDEGQGFSPEEITLPDAHALGGRGICLIRHYADYFGYNHEKKCFEMGLCRAGCTRGNESHA